VKHYHTLQALLWAIVLFVSCLTRSAGADPLSLRDAKSTLTNGAEVTFNGLSVTASFPGCVYVEQSDRGQGIRVNTAKSFDEGAVVNVSGTIETDLSTDERYIAAYANYPQATEGTLVLKPVMLNAGALVGGDCGLQKGIAGEATLNNIGMLVTVCGPVSGFDNPFNPTAWFKISAPGGPEVKVIVPSGAKISKYTEYAAVTGICSVEKAGGSMIRVLKLRGQSSLTAYQPFVQSKLASMTLDQKIGQIFTIQVSGDTFTSAMQQTIQTYHIGGVIYLQVSGNLNDPTRSANFSNALQSCAMTTDGIPLLISMDQEGGRVTRITGGADFPGNMALGASRNSDLAFSAGTVFGSEIRAVGGNMDLAPVVDVNNNPMNPVIGVRSFGEQPGLASEMGIAYLDGLHASGSIATGKHFPGHGDTATDSHSGLPIVTYDFNTLDTIHAEPFRQVINNGLDAIMTAHILVTCLDANRPATLSPLVIDGYLRDDLAFDGVCMTDSLGMAALRSGWTDAQIPVMAIQAGVDILLSPPSLSTAFNAVKSAVNSGSIPMSRIDQAVTRILRLKHKYGLFENPYVDPNVADGIVGSPEHWSAELEAARAGTTDASTRFASRISAKHSNLQSLALVVNPTAAQRTPVKDAAASAYVVIIGTSRAQLSSNAGQATLVNELLAMGKPVVVVGLREPYELGSFPGVKAYVAAYNYRNCGFQAAADVLFGDVNPSGLLPVTIPGLYSFGHGLSY
jgi:beta-N-acetylhexosaminidase